MQCNLVAIIIKNAIAWSEYLDGLDRVTDVRSGEAGVERRVLRVVLVTLKKKGKGGSMSSEFTVVGWEPLVGQL